MIKIKEYFTYINFCSIVHLHRDRFTPHPYSLGLSDTLVANPKALIYIQGDEMFALSKKFLCYEKTDVPS